VSPGRHVIDFFFEVGDKGETDGDEAELVDDFATLQSAFSELAADEDALDALDAALDGLRGPLQSASRGGLSSFRTLDVKLLDRRVELHYSHEDVSGDVYITREGSLLDKYYVVDFQDNFVFFGLDIDGEIELKRQGLGLRDFDLRIRRGRFGFGRGGRRAFLLLVGAIVVKNDVVEVNIPRHAENSGITGGVLGERFFQLFTSDQYTEKLTFPRDWSGCPLLDCADRPRRGACQGATRGGNRLGNVSIGACRCPQPARTGKRHREFAPRGEVRMRPSWLSLALCDHVVRGHIERSGELTAQGN